MEYENQYITDISGKFISRLTIIGDKGAKLWDTPNTLNGVYLYTLQAIGFSSTAYSRCFER